LETRFDWGIIDLYLNSKAGKITSVQLFSDVLYPQLVDQIKTSLMGVTYDAAGIGEGVQNAKNELQRKGEMMELLAYLDDFEGWLKKVI
jgi:lipoate-protein ligase A